MTKKQDRGNRLNRAAVENTLRKGEKRSVKGLSLVFLPNNQEKCRLAVVISQKTEKSAVKRNALRRRLREAFLLLAKKEKRGCDLVLLIRQSQYPTDRCVQDMKKVLSFINPRPS